MTKATYISSIALSKEENDIAMELRKKGYSKADIFRRGLKELQEENGIVYVDENNN